MTSFFACCKPAKLPSEDPQKPLSACDRPAEAAQLLKSIGLHRLASTTISCELTGSVIARVLDNIPATTFTEIQPGSLLNKQIHPLGNAANHFHTANHRHPSLQIPMAGSPQNANHGAGSGTAQRQLDLYKSSAVAALGTASEQSNVPASRLAQPRHSPAQPQHHVASPALDGQQGQQPWGSVPAGSDGGSSASVQQVPLRPTGSFGAAVEEAHSFTSSASQSAARARAAQIPPPKTELPTPPISKASSFNKTGSLRSKAASSIVEGEGPADSPVAASSPGRSSDPASSPAPPILSPPAASISSPTLVVASQGAPRITLHSPSHALQPQPSQPPPQPTKPAPQPSQPPPQPSQPSPQPSQPPAAPDLPSPLSAANEAPSSFVASPPPSAEPIAAPPGLQVEGPEVGQLSGARGDQEKVQQLVGELSLAPSLPSGVGGSSVVRREGVYATAVIGHKPSPVPHRASWQLRPSDGDPQRVAVATASGDAAAAAKGAAHQSSSWRMGGVAGDGGAVGDGGRRRILNGTVGRVGGGHDEGRVQLAVTRQWQGNQWPPSQEGHYRQQGTSGMADPSGVKQRPDGSSIQLSLQGASANHVRPALQQGGAGGGTGNRASAQQPHQERRAPQWSAGGVQPLQAGSGPAFQHLQQQQHRQQHQPFRPPADRPPAREWSQTSPSPARAFSSGAGTIPPAPPPSGSGPVAAAVQQAILDHHRLHPGSVPHHRPPTHSSSNRPASGSAGPSYPQKRETTPANAPAARKVEVPKLWNQGETPRGAMAMDTAAIKSLNLKAAEATGHSDSDTESDVSFSPRPAAYPQTAAV